MDFVGVSGDISDDLAAKQGHRSPDAKALVRSESDPRRQPLFQPIVGIVVHGALADDLEPPAGVSLDLINRNELKVLRGQLPRHLFSAFDGGENRKCTIDDGRVLAARGFIVCVGIEPGKRDFIERRLTRLPGGGPTLGIWLGDHPVLCWLCGSFVYYTRHAGDPEARFAQKALPCLARCW